MLDARRPMGRFFYGLLPVLLMWAVAHTPMTATTVPATTRIDDVVYRADGTVASGPVLISWPAFSTSGGAPVAAGSERVLLGVGGHWLSTWLQIAEPIRQGLTTRWSFSWVTWSASSTGW